MTKKHTLKSMAARLGVSVATISNAFNRPEELSARKRQEILEACKEMGYTGPNKAASSLRRGVTNIYALLMSDTLEYMVSDPVASSFMKGVTKTFQEHGKHVLLYAGDNESLDEVIDFVDGIICYGEPRNPKLHDDLLGTSKPIVTVDYNLTGVRSVNLDNEKAAYDIARQVLSEGEKVAILGLRLLPLNVTCRLHDLPEFHTQDSVSHRRLIGYLRAIDECGATLESSNIWNLPQSTQHYAMQAATELLNSVPLPDVVLCMSDLFALTLMKEVLIRGLRVPEDIRIVGFDGIEESFRSHPTLSTVIHFSDQKGQIAAKLILSGEQKDVMLDHEIYLGESSVKP
jgi:DNA-binding LacI/PurR family transcriptional regulator